MLKNVLETSRTTQIAMKWKTGYMPTSYNSVEKTSHWGKINPLRTRVMFPSFCFYTFYLNQLYLHMLEMLIIS